MINVEKYAKQSVDRLDISTKTIDILKYNKINTLGNLSKEQASSLEKMGLSQKDINNIQEELRLLGL